MSITLFTSTGCIRCKIVKRFLGERGLAYAEKDIKAEGKEDFQKFYVAHRKSIYRGQEGVEFPLLFDGVAIRQGLAAVTAYILAGKGLDGFVSVGTLHQEWVDGLLVSGGDPSRAEEFMELLRYLKGNNMKIRLDTKGKNSHILSRILDEGLAALVVMEVPGPGALYRRITGEEVDPSDLARSIALTPKFPQYQFQITVAPVIEADGTARYLTPGEVAETARQILEITGSKKHPYLIRPFKPESADDPRLKGLDPMAVQALYSYRTAAREYQVLADLGKE